MIAPYKQTLTHSCLVVALLMILKDQCAIEYAQIDEHALALAGSSREQYPYYVIGVPDVVSTVYQKNIVMDVDNSYFAKQLELAVSQNPHMKIETHKVTQEHINNRLSQGPVICHIDDNVLGDYSHASHFIVIEKASGSMYTIIDPWHGTRRRISQKKIIQGVESLRGYIKMSPLLISMNCTQKTMENEK